MTTADTSRTSDLAGRIQQLVLDPARQLVDIYFDRAQTFAGATFLGIDATPQDELSPADLLAATLLDVRIPPRALRSILEDDREELSARLAEIPITPLWDFTDGQINALVSCWNGLRRRDVGPVKASKLLARKRPAGAPIVDSVVQRWLGLPIDDYRKTAEALQRALANPKLRTHIDALTPNSPAVPTLRLLDAAVWMWGSESRSAHRARLAVGRDTPDGLQGLRRRKGRS